MPSGRAYGPEKGMSARRDVLRAAGKASGDSAASELAAAGPPGGGDASSLAAAGTPGGCEPSS
eukprot:3774402-Prymnesium_polylepis.1